MNRYFSSLFYIVAIMSAYWAYTMVSELIQTFQKDVTWIDLGAIFILGLIAGISLILAIVSKAKQVS